MRFSLTEIVGKIGGGNTAAPEPTGSGRLIRLYEPHQTMALIRTVGAQSSKIQKGIPMGNPLCSAEIELLSAETTTPERPRRSNRRQRTELIQVRVTTAERKELERISALVAKPVSTYVRAIALGSEIKSKTDERLVLEVARLRGDLCRVGGLLKLWLTNEERFDFESGRNPGSSDVRRVLAQVEHLIGSIEKVVSEL